MSKKFKFLDNIFSKSYLNPALAGLMCGLVAIKFPEVTGIGAETINNLINNNINEKTNTSLVNKTLFIDFF